MPPESGVTEADETTNVGVRWHHHRHRKDPQARQDRPLNLQVLALLTTEFRAAMDGTNHFTVDFSKDFSRENVREFDFGIKTVDSLEVLSEFKKVYSAFSMHGSSWRQTRCTVDHERHFDRRCRSLRISGSGSTSQMPSVKVHDPGQNGSPYSTASLNAHAAPIPTRTRQGRQCHRVLGSRNCTSSAPPEVTREKLSG